MSHLGHVHLKVDDVERCVAFYTDVFGLEVSERHDRYAFLSFGDHHHHDVALQEVGSDAPGPGPGVGLYHAAFEMADLEALAGLYEELRDRGVAVSRSTTASARRCTSTTPPGTGSRPTSTPGPTTSGGAAPTGGWTLSPGSADGTVPRFYQPSSA